MTTDPTISFCCGTRREEQLKSIDELCNQMLELKDKVSEFTGSTPLTPTAEIEELFALAQGSNHQSKLIIRKSSI